MSDKPPSLGWSDFLFNHEFKLSSSPSLLPVRMDLRDAGLQLPFPPFPPFFGDAGLEFPFPPLGPLPPGFEDAGLGGGPEFYLQIPATVISANDEGDSVNEPSPSTQVDAPVSPISVEPPPLLTYHPLSQHDSAVAHKTERRKTNKLDDKMVDGCVVKDKDKGKWKCTTCEKLFKRRENATAHVRKIHFPQFPQKLFRCMHPNWYVLALSSDIS
jgi:uncharacterized C2H2 Zn-finger protein